MTHPIRGERGIALAIAMFALVVVGALVAGAFFAGVQEQRLGENARRATQAFGVAETGLVEQVRLWDPALASQLAVGASVTLPGTTTPGRTGSYGGFIHRLNDNLYLMDVTGSDAASGSGRITDGGARQHLGLLTRVRPLGIDIRASLTTQGEVDVLGSAAVDGRNKNPAGWTTCAPADTRPDVAGVLTTDTVRTRGGGQVHGNPQWSRDPSISDATFTEYGDVTFDDLAARATKRLPGGRVYRPAPRDSADVCIRRDTLNWGDGMNPLAPCGRYFPIIHIDGNATLNGVQGQGILLVNGDLDVQGGFQFFGITIVLGELKTAGGGSWPAHFWGGVLARNSARANQNVSGRATLNYSACAILAALQATGSAAPLRSRGWVQLF